MLTEIFWSREVFKEFQLFNHFGIVAFDFDNTLVRGDFGEDLMSQILLMGTKCSKDVFINHFDNSLEFEEYFENRKQKPEFFRDKVYEYYENLLETEGLEKAFRWSSFLFSGWEGEELILFSKKTWANSKVKPYKPMLELIEYLKSKKTEIYVVTASPTLAIQAVIKDFKIPEENVLGMNLEIQNNILQTKIVEPYTYGPGKVRALESKNIKPDLCFGDTKNDFALLGYAKNFGVFLDRKLGYYPKEINKVYIQNIENWKV